MNSAAQIEFAFALVEKMNRLRRQHIGAEQRYLARIANLLAVTDEAHAFNTNGPSPSIPSERTTLKTRVRRVVKALRSLRRWKAWRPGAPVVIVAIATNRLPFGHGQSLRENLSALLTVDGPDRSELSRVVERAERLVLFDPQILSSGISPSPSEEDGTLILEGLPVLFAGLLWIASNPFRIVSATQIWCRALSRLGFVQGTACTLGAMGYLHVLDRTHITRALFLTANSLFTELLRGLLLRSDRCSRIDELLHGVGSEAAEGYFRDALSGASTEHVFWPQTSTLPLYGQLRKARAHPNAAVNAYLNHHVKALGPLADTVLLDQARSAGISVNEPVTIVTLFGNFPSDAKLEDSPSLQSEIAILKSLTRSVAAHGRAVLFLYVPHPQFLLRGARFAAIEKLGVAIVPRSLLAWMSTDFAVALLSSALFEAVHFGATGFTPMTPADHIFPDVYLNLVRHPSGQSQEELETALIDLGRAICDSRPIPAMNKIRERLLRAGWRIPATLQEGLVTGAAV